MKLKYCKLISCQKPFNPLTNAQVYCCKECSKEAMRIHKRTAHIRYYHKQEFVQKCNICGEPISPKKWYCQKCRKIRLTPKVLKEQIIQLNQRLKTYSNMFKAMEDTIAEKDRQIKDMKEEINRLNDCLNKPIFKQEDSISLYAKNLRKIGGRKIIE